MNPTVHNLGESDSDDDLAPVINVNDVHPEHMDVHQGIADEDARCKLTEI